MYLHARSFIARDALCSLSFLCFIDDSPPNNTEFYNIGFEHLFKPFPPLTILFTKNGIGKYPSEEKLSSHFLTSAQTFSIHYNEATNMSK